MKIREATSDSANSRAHYNMSTPLPINDFAWSRLVRLARSEDLDSSLCWYISEEMSVSTQEVAQSVAAIVRNDSANFLYSRLEGGIIAIASQYSPRTGTDSHVEAICVLKMLREIVDSLDFGLHGRALRNVSWFSVRACRMSPAGRMLLAAALCEVYEHLWVMKRFDFLVRMIVPVWLIGAIDQAVFDAHIEIILHSDEFRMVYEREVQALGAARFVRYNMMPVMRPMPKREIRRHVYRVVMTHFNEVKLRDAP